MQNFQMVLLIAGLCFVIIAFFRLYLFALPYFKKSGLNKYFHESSYALVTGSTDGIGKATALALAKYGFHIILHGRNAEKLNNVRQEILKSYPNCKVETFSHDASSTQPPDLTAIQNLSISVLVNNVGGGPPQKFDQTSHEDLQSIVNMNALFAVHLTRSLIPQMPKRALVINITSYAALLPPPFMAMYAASKAFNNAFSISLSRELDNIDSISMVTGSVHTAGNKKPVSFMRPSAKVYADCILSAAGCGRRSVMPYWPHAVQTYIMGLIPDSVLARVMKKAIALEFEQQKSGT